MTEREKQLVKLCKDAIASVKDWGTYAPQWAKDKWGFYCELESFEKRLENLTNDGKAK